MRRVTFWRRRLTKSLLAFARVKESQESRKQDAINHKGMDMRPVARSQDADNQLLFLPGVFNETLALLFDAHHYFQSREVDEQASLPATERAVYASEMTRVTMRLTSVMAWIMVRRAIHAGRIEQEKAAKEYRLDGSEVCLAEPSAELQQLPYYLGYLADRSRHLYERVHRLDQLAYGTMH